MPRPASPKIALTRQAVIEAAARLVNAEGAEALTIIRLALELKVQPPSLYNHIEGLPALWRELAVINTAALGDRITGAAVGKSGPAAVRAIAWAYRAYVKEFPGLYQASLRVSGNFGSPVPRLEMAEERIVRVVVAVVGSFGLEGDAAIHAVRALRSMVHGFVTLEVSGGFGLPQNLDESFDLLIEMLIKGMENISYNG
jgi:AcrR family transcriptional regulator